MIFYLPIYRQSPEDFRIWLQNKIDIAIENIKVDDSTIVSERLKTRIIMDYENKYGRSWPENCAVGWLKILKGTYGFIFILGKSTPFRSKYPKKYFEQIHPQKTVGGYHNLSFSKCLNANDILNRFREIFKEITSLEPFRGCYIDDTQIVDIYKYVNWIELFNDDK